MLNTLRNSLEQGQNRLRYALELREKVVLNTEPSGAHKIQEDMETLKTEFDKVLTDIMVIIIIIIRSSVIFFVEIYSFFLSTLNFVYSISE